MNGYQTVFVHWVFVSIMMLKRWRCEILELYGFGTLLVHISTIMIRGGEYVWIWYIFDLGEHPTQAGTWRSSLRGFEVVSKFEISHQHCGQIMQVKEVTKRLKPLLSEPALCGSVIVTAG